MFDLNSILKSGGYLGIAAIIFAENGLLVGFFLPGDTLLFAAGLLAAQGFFHLVWLLPLVIIISIIGVSVGYAFGFRFGRKLFERQDSTFFKQSNLHRAETFFERYGSKTIVLARFIPIIRTFAPVVAGVARMRYNIFTIYNIIGGIIWAGGVTLLGFWLGDRIPNIDKYLLPIMGAIIVLSILPALIHLLRSRKHTPSV